MLNSKLEQDLESSASSVPDPSTTVFIVVIVVVGLCDLRSKNVSWSVVHVVLGVLLRVNFASMFNGTVHSVQVMFNEVKFQPFLVAL